MPGYNGSYKQNICIVYEHAVCNNKTPFDLAFDESKWTLEFRGGLNSFRDEFHFGDEVKGDFVRHTGVLLVVWMRGDKLANPSSGCH